MRTSRHQAAASQAARRWRVGYADAGLAYDVVMDRTIVTVSLLLALLAAACGDGGASATPTSAPPPPAATPTPDLGPPFVLLAPQSAAQALTDERLQHGAYYVRDTATDLIDVIDPDVSPERIAAQGGMAGIRVVWCGDRIQVTSIDKTPWVIHPDGRVEQTIAHNCGGRKDAATSPDGRWSAAVMVSSDVAGVSVQVNDAAGTPVFRITNASSASWPAGGGAKMALLGDLCAGFHVYLFDPVAGALQRLDCGNGMVIEYAWHPDGAALAVDFIPADGLVEPYRRVLGLIDVADGSMRELISLQRGGELIPVGYNDAGTRLLFGHNPGRGFCDDGSPPRAPSRLERIG
jgi:hypothetical protein